MLFSLIHGLVINHKVLFIYRCYFINDVIKAIIYKLNKWMDDISKHTEPYTHSIT
jgi:hypothetical protein